MQILLQIAIAIAVKVVCRVVALLRLQPLIDLPIVRHAVKIRVDRRSTGRQAG
jgi:hypothetical protein